jgi:hypothetical protein
MRAQRILSSFLPALALCALPVLAAITVTYGDPDKFSDAGDRNTDPRKVMKVLEDHLKALGERYLPANANLRIEVLDLDRAGRPYQNLPTEIRVMRGRGDIPCIDLRYTLEADGKVARADRERVCDNDYLRPLPVRADEHDPLVYEKRMLDEWFRERFGKQG